MAGEEITLVRLCGRCGSELGTLSVRKENMMLCSQELIWCPHCKVHAPEVREVAGRRESILQEHTTYPKNAPVA